MTLVGQLLHRNILLRMMLALSVLANPLSLHALREGQTIGLVPGGIVLWVCLARLPHYGLSGAALIAALGVFLFSLSSPWAGFYVLAIALCLPLISPHRVLLLQSVPFYLIVFTPALIMLASVHYWSAVTGYMPWPGLPAAGENVSAPTSLTLWEVKTGGMLISKLALAGLWGVLLAPVLLWQAASVPQTAPRLAAIFALIVPAVGAGVSSHFYQVPLASLLSVSVSAVMVLWPRPPGFGLLTVSMLISWFAGGLAVILYG